MSEYSKTLEIHLNEIKDFKNHPNRVFSCMPYAVMVARRYAKGNTELMLDYMQDGYEGLLRAHQKFDESRGVKFITFAAWYVRAYIQQGHRKNHYCVVPPQTNVYQDKHKRDRLPIKEPLEEDTAHTDFKIELEWEEVLNRLPLELSQYLALRIKYNTLKDLERITGDCRSTLWNKKQRIKQLLSA